MPPHRRPSWSGWCNRPPHPDSTWLGLSGLWVRKECEPTPDRARAWEEPDALRRARKAFGVQVRREGFGKDGRFLLALPSSSRADAPEKHLASKPPLGAEVGQQRFCDPSTNQ